MLPHCLAEKLSANMNGGGASVPHQTEKLHELSCILGPAPQNPSCCDTLGELGSGIVCDRMQRCLNRALKWARLEYPSAPSHRGTAEAVEIL